jgi:hypothetical protein
MLPQSAAQRIDAAENLGTMLVFVQAPAEQDGGRLRRCIEPREFANLRFGQFTGSAKLFQRMTIQHPSVGRESVATPLDEGTVVQPLLQDHLGHRHGEFGVARDMRLNVLIAKACGFGPDGVDEHNFASLSAHLLQQGHHVKVGGEGIAPPQQHEAAVDDVHRVVTGAHAKIQRLSRTPGSAAQRAPGDRDTAKQVPEAPV